MRAALIVLVAAAPAFAQDAGVQRQLLQRQQSTDAFDLQLRQSQDALRAAPGDRPALEERQRSERQRLDNLSEQQLRDVKTDARAQPQLRPYELQKADIERAPFRGPVVEVPPKPAPPPAKLAPALRGVLDPPLEPAR